MKELETKDSSKRFEFKAEGEEGLVSGFLSTFGNLDLGDDIVEPGAFKRTLNSLKKAGKGLKMLINHNVNQRAGIFPPESLMETDEGLVTTGGMLNLETQAGREAFSDAKFGILDAFSIGFIPERVEFVQKNIKGEKRTIRHILEARLLETSLVVFPMNLKAQLTGTKSRWEDMAKIPAEENQSLKALEAELAALRKGLVASKGDPASSFTAIKAELDKITATLTGGR